ncbi:tetratricopeptide (TPR) repeat protein [Staphylococcus auricularis]
MMAQQQHHNVISMTLDTDFYRKMAEQRYLQQDYKKAATYFKKVLDSSPQDLDAQVKYSTCLVHNGESSQAENIYFENIVNKRYVEESYYQLSQLNIDLNDPNKAFLFGMNYVIVSGDEGYQAELESMFEVRYHTPQKIETESRLFAVQIIFQYLFGQGRLPEARRYLLDQEEEIKNHRIIRNLLAMCYLYLSEYDMAKTILESLLAEDSTDVNALCHYTLLLHNIKDEKAPKYLNILKKVAPMNDDESFKVGIVLSYLKEYEASQQLLLPLYKKGKFQSLQLFNALSFNSYYLGNVEESEMYWSKLRRLTPIHIGFPPWIIEQSKSFFNLHIMPFLMSDDSHYRLYGIFLLNQLKGREVLMTEEIWSILESMGDYEKLYLSYLIQDLKLTKIDFIHRGLVMIYENDWFSDEEDLLVAWIDQAEAIIDDKADLEHVTPYVAAFIYLFYQQDERKMTKKQLTEEFDISMYQLNKVVDYLLSI